MSKINDILKQRGTRYGKFIDQANLTQSLKRFVELGIVLSGKDKLDFAADELEAIDMILVKISRIVNGDPHYSDNWRDIAGYATLVADRLDKEKKLEIEDGRKRIEEGTGENRGDDTETPFGTSKLILKHKGGGRPARRVYVHRVSIANNDIRK